MRYTPERSRRASAEAAAAAAEEATGAFEQETQRLNGQVGELVGGCTSCMNPFYVSSETVLRVK
jgi:hypothetical protein